MRDEWPDAPDRATRPYGFRSLSVGLFAVRAGLATCPPRRASRGPARAWPTPVGRTHGDFETSSASAGCAALAARWSAAHVARSVELREASDSVRPREATARRGAARGAVR